MKTLFVAYRVTDLDHSLDFYTTLGYVEVGSGFDHLAIQVDTLTDTLQRLTGAGLEPNPSDTRAAPTARKRRGSPTRTVTGSSWWSGLPGIPTPSPQRTSPEAITVSWVTWLSRSHECVSSSHLIDEHLRELPFLVLGRDEVIRDHAYTVEHEERKREAREEGRVPNFPVSPGMFRDRTQEEIEELRRAEERGRAERYWGVYTSLGLRVTAYKDGTLELTWRAGKGVSEVCASPRCTASATTS